MHNYAVRRGLTQGAALAGEYGFHRVAMGRSSRSGRAKLQRAAYLDQLRVECLDEEGPAFALEAEAHLPVAGHDVDGAAYFSAYHDV